MKASVVVVGGDATVTGTGAVVVVVAITVVVVGAGVVVVVGFGRVVVVVGLTVVVVGLTAVVVVEGRVVVGAGSVVVVATGRQAVVVVVAPGTQFHDGESGALPLPPSVPRPMTATPITTAACLAFFMVFPRSAVTTVRAEDTTPSRYPWVVTRSGLLALRSIPRNAPYSSACFGCR